MCPLAEMMVRDKGAAPVCGRFFETPGATYYQLINCLVTVSVILNEKLKMKTN